MLGGYAPSCAFSSNTNRDETYAYFEPFFNLPPRTLKDYFQVIKDPLSIKKLQKLVKGIRSRTDRSGVTEYKSWAAFEEKASLLWENAYYYNEDGSPIANMAKELEVSSPPDRLCY